MLRKSLAAIVAGPVLAVAFLTMLALPFAGCGSSSDECAACSSDDDCAAGLTCSTFSDGSKRCGSGLGATSCRVR